MEDMKQRRSNKVRGRSKKVSTRKISQIDSHVLKEAE